MADKRYNIGIDVQTLFLEEESDEKSNRYAFSYTITIENKGDLSAQLLLRHWVITDANQKIQEVYGEGVIGQQPILKPGESFRYTSGTMLETPVGTMRGSYTMLAEDNNSFDAEIEEFLLSIPRTLH